MNMAFSVLMGHFVSELLTVNGSFSYWVIDIFTL